jgi:hypothetical protein
MKSLFGKLLLGAVLGASLWTASPTPAKADDYWNRHWGWYDNTYRPYYYRQRYRSPAYYGGYNNNYYGPAPAPAPGYYYGPSRPYYGPRGGGAQVGPLNFGWW